MNIATDYVEQLERRFKELPEHLHQAGWRIVCRGEGQFWIMKRPDGKTAFTAKSRMELMEKMERQFE